MDLFGQYLMKGSLQKISHEKEIKQNKFIRDSRYNKETYIQAIKEEAKHNKPFRDSSCNKKMHGL